MSENAGNEPRGPAAWPSRSRRRVAGVVVVIVGALILLGLFRLRRAPEPEYQGRKLKDLLGDLVRPADSGSFLTASNAVVALGATAFPVVVESIERPAPWHVNLYLQRQDKLPPKVRAKLSGWLEPYRYMNRRLGAFRAVEILGTNAAPMAAELAMAFGRIDDATASQLAPALVRVGPAIVPPLKPYLTDPTVRKRSLAAFVFHQIGGSSAGAAPELIAGLDGADANHRLLVAQTLARMGSAVLPQVTNLLASADSEMRLVAVRALGQLLPRAQELTPRLVRLLDDPVPEVRLEMAILLNTWWRMPVEEWRRHLDGLPADHPTRVRLADSLDAIERSHPRTIAVLREGLTGVGLDLRRRAAMLLAELGYADAAVVACLEELSTTAGIAPWDLAGLTNLLNRTRQQSTNGGVSAAPETPPRPGTAPTAQFPPSRDRPPADKAP